MRNGRGQACGNHFKVYDGLDDGTQQGGTDHCIACGGQAGRTVSFRLQRRRRTMSERWKMNRIGFVNFWLYDEEDFEFEDGKLLLRGQNGSGKSITTQSFIPFVLDGDRTPSRLDPFGSSDRRMEYYFLGEEGKEESTGYLFLEFWKEDSGEYRTIGIGQKAKRGKPMDFWGFVLLDGRRVGYDLWLYKEVGSNKIPRDKREMKAELGEDNFSQTARRNTRSMSTSIFSVSVRKNSMSSSSNCW